jgi:hypothetical protein
MRKLSLLLVLLLVVACGGGSEEEQAKSTVEDTANDMVEQAKEVADAVPVAVALAERNVKCGCAVEGVGKCGNYVEIDNQYVKLANWEDLGLGVMEWCGKKGVHVETAGEIKGGEFFAATLVQRSQ